MLAYDIMLKHTGVTIDALTDIDQVLFFESSLRGGLSMISERFCEETSNEQYKTDLIYIDGKY